jgi:glycosyltransferase involved in cell wall biosynthesis
MGRLSDELSLCLLYSAADVVVVPSRQDNLPNTAIEAHACGTPVVAFDVGGLRDVIDHRVTGYLASPFDSDDLARGMRWVLEQAQGAQLRRAARDRAVGLFSGPRIAAQYAAAYRAAIDDFGR